MFRTGRVQLAAVALIAWFVFPTNRVQGMPASPHPYKVAQPDGTIVTLRIRGDEFFNWEEDERGFTVVRDANGAYVYAELDAQSNLIPTGLKVGIDEPVAAGLKPKTLPPPEVRARKRTDSAGVSQNREGVADPLAAVGTVKNIVIMMRFSNHLGRTLPTNANISTIFNNVGPHALAPTGSVRDLYLENSYGQLTLNSSTFGWVNLPQTEQVYAGGNSGLGSNIWAAITAALNAADPLIDFSQYDDDSNGFVDAIAFIHSGYGAEWGGTDADGTNYTNRIWSHRWSIPTWTSAEGVRVSAYHISPGLWGTSGTAPGRIGVICHETGHFFGLPDLYDTNGGGEGIGSYCMMANSWGFDGSQYHPPHFSAWCKDFLGWLTPTTISAAGTYSAQRVEQFSQVYRIDAGYPPGEYLLIENRQPYGFENIMPQGGLCIWHIDEAKCCNTDNGFPGQSGWPGNNRHYRVALLQADGLYQMERGGFGRGDAGDVYHGGGTSRIDALTIPNTHAYQGGVVTATNHRIHNISTSAATMTFDLNSYVPANGACCNDLSSVCTDNEASASCMQSGGTRFAEGGTCAGLIPPCMSSIPPNDNCADAIPIFDGSTYFDTTLASTDGPRDCPGDLFVGTQDIWYVHQATCTGTLQVSLCSGTNYDSTLLIYDGSSCAPFGTQLGCNDDNCGIDGGPSKLLEPAVQNQEYLIRVAGWQASVGAGFVEIQCTEGVPPNNIVWDPATNPGPWPNINPLATSRSLRFTVTGEAGPAKPEAIKVTMVDLQHPRPANLPAQAPPNLSTYDTRLNGVCAGGTLAGHHCDMDSDCPSSTCDSLVACTADPACLNSTACTLPSNSCARWVGKPGTFLEDQGPPSGPYTAARLQCTPYYWDWKPLGLITVVGAEIAPSSEYSVQVYGASCMGAEAGCAAVSPAIPMYTRRSGDVEQPFNPPSATGQPDVTDVAQLVNKFIFKCYGGMCLPKATAQLQPNLPELNADINALDIVAVVDSLKQQKYAFSGPCACPSTVTCGATACPSGAGVCVTTYGAGSTCVRTCTGPGPLSGDACINNTHCVGSGTCGANFCRDRCGRCTP